MLSEELARYINKEILRGLGIEPDRREGRIKLFIQLYSVYLRLNIRIMEKFIGQNIIDFGKAFPTDDECIAYLADLKWRDGFTCKKCGHTSGCKKSGHTYHFYKCDHVESATAGTLFHRCRFGLRKAFHIVFEMVNSSKGMSSIQVVALTMVCQRYISTRYMRPPMDTFGSPLAHFNKNFVLCFNLSLSFNQPCQRITSVWRH
jgi:hypothetical protein